MKNHHDQGMQRDECDVHLKRKETLRVTLSKAVSRHYTFISTTFLRLILTLTKRVSSVVFEFIACTDELSNNCTEACIHFFFFTRLLEWANKLFSLGR